MSRGFSLLEVLVALMVLEVGLAGVVGTLLLAHRLMAEAEVRERMNGEAALLIDSLRGSGFGGAGERETPWGTVRWSEHGGRLLVEARPSRGGGFLLEGQAPRSRGKGPPDAP